MAVLLLEGAEPGHLRDGAPCRVQRSGAAAHSVRDGEAEPGGGLREAEDDGVGGLSCAEQLAHPGAEPGAGLQHHRGPLRDVLAQNGGDQQMRPLGVAAQGQSEQLPHPVAGQAHPEPFGHPGAGPGRGRLCRVTACGLAAVLPYASVHLTPAASSSTKLTPSRATPKTSPRSSVRSAQARCGFTSFILFV